jgi:2-polyprenyl-3-methyl-5-hydroxy-6-metoxy-1,4-benzoquinol methylase
LDKYSNSIEHQAYGIEPPDWYYKASKSHLTWMITTIPKKILEIGCAEGNYGAFLKQKYKAEVWGIELNQSAANEAAKKLDHVLTGDALHLMDQLEESSFDYIALFEVLEHMMNPEMVLMKAKRLLAKDGTIILSVPNVMYISNLYRMLIKKDWEYIDHGVLDITHLRFFTKKSLQRMLKNLGYSIIECRGIQPPRGLFLFLFHVFNILTLGYHHDSKYTQFACVLKSR